jgi:hypothetical protein
MFLIPYKVWNHAKCKTGLHFYFSTNTGDLTKKTQSWAGKYRTQTIKQLAS